MKKGETVYDISQNAGIQISSLMAFNGLNEADELAEGWTNLKLRPASGIMGISDLKSLNNTQFGFSQIAFEPRFLKYNSEH